MARVGPQRDRKQRNKQGCTWDGCSCIFRRLDFSLGVCEPIHYIFRSAFLFFLFRRDVDQYCYTLELTVYLQFCLVGSSLPMLHVL